MTMLLMNRVLLFLLVGGGYMGSCMEHSCRLYIHTCNNHCVCLNEKCLCRCVDRDIIAEQCVQSFSVILYIVEFQALVFEVHASAVVDKTFCLVNKKGRKYVHVCLSVL